MDDQFFVYILLCADNTLYTGWTKNVHSRLCSHNKGKGAKYTRTRLPVQVVYCEQMANQSAALRREQEIKHMGRAQKLALIAANPYSEKQENKGT